MKLKKLNTGVIISHRYKKNYVTIKVKHPQDEDYIFWDLLYNNQFYNKWQK